MSSWTTTSIASRFLAELLAAAGQPAGDLLAAAGVSPTALQSPDFAMPLCTFRALWARAATLHPDIGIGLIERFPPGQMHMVAHLALRCATVEAALNDVCRYATVTSAADHLDFERDGQRARLSYRCSAEGEANPWMAEHYLAMAVVLLGQATGRVLPVSAVEFVAPRQAPLAAYLQRFGVEPGFARTRNTLEFDAAALQWPLQTHDAYLHAILERVAQTRCATTQDSLRDRVGEFLARAVLRGETPTIEQAAQANRLSARALRERFAQQQTTFRKLLDETRRELAREHLTRGLAVTETAYLLGFSEPAALQHACKRWFGQTAGDLRRALLATPLDGH